jgi:hypothetical protein
MLTRRLALTAWACAVLAFASGCTHASAQSHVTYGLGRPADPAEIARFDIDVAPDGTGLPQGRGDAVDGAALFATSCSGCHGTEVRLNPKRWPYATTLFDYVRRAMPPDHATHLSANDLYAITAYELNMNELLTPHELLDNTSLPRVRMPAAADFVQQP